MNNDRYSDSFIKVEYRNHTKLCSLVLITPPLMFKNWHTLFYKSDIFDYHAIGSYVLLTTTVQFISTFLEENLDSVQFPPFSHPGFEQEGLFKLYHREGESSSPNNELAHPESNFQEGMEVDLEDIKHSPDSSFPPQTEIQHDIVILLSPSPSLPSTTGEDMPKDEVSSCAIDSVTLPETVEDEEPFDERMSEYTTPEPKAIDPNKVYCFCRQPADTYSMIYCHECLEWFHGECVGITRQKAACIKHFYCPLCIDKNPSLVTVFESRSDKDVPQQNLVEKMRERVVQPKGNTQGKRSKSKKHSRR